VAIDAKIIRMRMREDAWRRGRGAGRVENRKFLCFKKPHLTTFTEYNIFPTIQISEGTGRTIRYYLKAVCISKN
jgi:hypothetical protein